MDKNIIIEITPAGSTKIEANGFQGCGCTEATAQIELVLGGGEKKTTPKPEMYAPATTQHSSRLTF